VGSPNVAWLLCGWDLSNPCGRGGTDLLSLALVDVLWTGGWVPSTSVLGKTGAEPPTNSLTEWFPRSKSETGVCLC